MKKSNSGVYIDYVDHSNTSNESGVISSTSKSDSLISITENRIIVYKQENTDPSTETPFPDNEK